MTDLGFALRQFSKRPGFTLIAVLTLTLGIGVNTTIFSFVKGVLLDALPFAAPHELAYLWESEPAKGIKESTVSYPDYLDWKQSAVKFRDMAAFTPVTVSLSQGEESSQSVSVQVTPNYFDVIGVRPQLGRTFVAEDNQEGKNRVVVLSHAAWVRLFGASLNIVGQVVDVNRQPFTIIGVAPQGLSSLNPRIDFWMPHTPPQWAARERSQRYLRVIGRLRPGVSLPEANAEIRAIAARLAQVEASNEGVKAYALPVSQQLFSKVRPAGLVLFGATTFVLLIACINLANLLLAQGAARASEFAVRMAVGATRARLVRQLLIEALMLSLVGGALGLFLAVFGTELVRKLAGSQIPRISSVGIDRSVLVFNAASAIIAGLVFGILPALRSARADLNVVLHRTSRAFTAVSGPLRSSLVVGETAVAVTLLVGAGLLLHSFARLRAVDTGFLTKSAFTFELALPSALYSQASQCTAFYQQLLERIRTLPGVEAAGAALTLPLGGGGRFWMNLEIAGRPKPTSRQTIPVVSFNQVTPGYAQAMGIRLLRGRTFTEQDASGASAVALISETLARRFFANEDPVGRQLRLGTSDQDPWLTVVGVVGDVRLDAVTEEPNPIVYTAHAQGISGSAGSMVVVVRSATEMGALLPGIRNEIRKLDKQLPIANAAPLGELTARAQGTTRTTTVLLSSFAGLATVLAVIGIYGVLSFNVAQRTPELGIRKALGARQSSLLALILRQGISLAIVGIVIGLAGAAGLSHLLKSLLFGITNVDPITYGGITVLLLCVAFLASWFPARRAALIDPMLALREK